MSTEKNYPPNNPELWGGIECTINRVGDEYRDQLAETGHYSRSGDIEKFAKLGITKMRYPVLWENHMPDSNGNIDWQWTRNRLAQLRGNKIIPVVGLLHHGSGPAHTDLLDEGFAAKLADYAGQVAAQFPSLEYYTPVNEPLTTARFSGLYGYWYPHHCNEQCFVLMLLNQVKGIILSMQAIRKINPAAKLVQTEDLCKVHSVQSLAYQASFENERRWLTYDLLCGRFTPAHPLWHRYLVLGIPAETLNFFTSNACPPDIMGYNYYVTSERYLDDNLQNHPPHLHGGNCRHRYADTDAARMNCRDGLKLLLEEAWNRYHIPLAVTECHLNCSREEQMRWLNETWNDCCALNQQGIPVIALTAWSLLGSCDWDSLLLQQNHHYESGVFDTSSGRLRPTLLAQMIRAFALGQSFFHPLLDMKGWWHVAETKEHVTNEQPSILVVGQDSELLSNFKAILHQRRIACKQILPAVIQQWQDGNMAGYADINNVWGIVMVDEDAESQTNGLNNWARQYCSERQMLLMLISASAGDEESIWVDDYLLVQNDSAGGIKFVNCAMDLFIDGEKGLWVIRESGACTGPVTQPALIF